MASHAKPAPLMAAPQTSIRRFGAVVKADGNHKFVAACNKKTIVFEGLKPTSNMTVELSNQFRHQNDLPLTK